MRSREERMMAAALREARRAEGRTLPNPPVGAVLAVGDRVLARGFHHRAGQPHAEIEVLRKVGVPPRGATLYVTLEPCAHHGRTPPCTDAILAAGVRRVVVGTRDPHPHTNGRGLAVLRAAGVDVKVGVEEEACRELIRGFASVAERGRPYVVLKVAATLDGRIATRTGHSRWITAEPARREVHRLRDRLDAILVGAGTVRADDPLLTCRLPRGRDPIRVVLSASLDLPAEAKVFGPPGMSGWPRALVVTSRRAPARRVRALESRGAEVIRLGARGGRVEVGALLEALGARGITSVLVEGGSEVTASFLEGGWVDEVYWFLGPRIVGGAQAVPAVAGVGAARMEDAWCLEPLRVSRVGPDLLLRGRPRRVPAQG
jgi:diaminohydroxyphosphoribosylaminopyrimidine deaminase/5-amino-6-(5-phosphoribosylamino)uracil reductase